MTRLGLTNGYLQAGVLLLVLGMLAYGLPFVMPLGDEALRWLGQATPYVLAAGVVLYVAGRVLAIRQARRDAR